MQLKSQKMRKLAPELDPLSELTEQRIAALDAIETCGVKMGDELLQTLVKYYLTH